MKLSNSSPSNKGFNLVMLMFGVGLGALVFAALATVLVREFLPWLTLMSVAILAIPLGDYLVRKTAIASSPFRAGNRPLGRCKDRSHPVGATALAGLRHECSTSVDGHAGVRQTGQITASTFHH